MTLKKLLVTAILLVLLVLSTAIINSSIGFGGYLITTIFAGYFYFLWSSKFNSNDSIQDSSSTTKKSNIQLDNESGSNNIKHDEHLYMMATNEVEGEKRDPSLWAKAMTITEGDEIKAKYQYIKIRVASLREAEELMGYKKNEIARKELLKKVDNIISDDAKTRSTLEKYSYYADKDSEGKWVVYEPNDNVQEFDYEADFKSYASDLLIRLMS